MNKIADAYKTFAAIMKWRLFKRKTPLIAVIAISNKCNLRCSYCVIPLREENEMTNDEMIKLLRDLKQAGTIRLGFTGGEVLYKKDIDVIVDEARRLNFFMTINTNGDFVPKRRDVVEKFDLITISMDGTEEMHDANRGKGTHKRVLKAIDIVSNEMKKPLVCTTTLTIHNLEAADYVLDMAEERNFQCFFQLLHHPKPASGDPSHMYPVVDAYRKTLMKLIEYKDAGRPILNSREYLEFLYNWKDYTEPVSYVRDGGDYSLKCVGGALFTHIDANGDIYPCHQLLKEIPVGNIRQMSFGDAFQRSDECRQCDICIAGDYLEYNLLLDLNLSPVLNALKHYV